MGQGTTQPGQRSPSIESNREALQSFRAGDSDVLASVYLQFSPKIRAVLFACGLKSPADVDDALQTTFVRAFSPKARASYSGVSPFESYLKTIARNVVRDLHKSGRSRFEVLDPDQVDLQVAPAESASPAEQVEQKEARGLRNQFVAQLEPGEQRVYSSCFVEGLSERDTASSLSLTRHKVRNAVAGIRRKLHRFIKEHRLDE